GQHIPFAFSPDGKRFAGLVTERAPQVRVCLWDFSERPPVPIGPFTDRVLDIAFSPDGDLLAWSDGRLVHLWDVRESKELKTFKNERVSPNLAFTPDGRHLLSGKKFHPVDAKSPALELPFTPGRLAFSRDGRVLTTTGADGFTLLVFDPKKLLE